MLATTLRALYGYNTWANDRILETTGRLTSEQLLAPGSAGRGSVRDTLLHLISAQRGWLAWWNGSLSPSEAYSLRWEPADFPDVAALNTAWGEVQRNTQAFLEGLSDADTVRLYASTRLNWGSLVLPLWQLMLHVANHGTQHRSEVAAMLTAFDHSPGDLDSLYYFMATQGTQTG